MVPFATSEQSVINDVDHRQLTNFGRDGDVNVHLPKPGYFPRSVNQVNPLMESSLPSLQPARFDSQIFSDEYRKPGFFQLLLRGEIDDSLSWDFGLPDAKLSESRLPDAGLSKFRLPDIELSEFRLSDAGLSKFGLPDTDLPDFGLQGFYHPDFQLSAYDPSFDQYLGLTELAKTKFYDNGKSASVTCIARNGKRGTKRRHRKSVYVSMAKQREQRAKKERERSSTMKDAFDALRKRIPSHYLDLCRQNARVSKIRVLKMATRYIKELSEQLGTGSVTEKPGMAIRSQAADGFLVSQHRTVLA